MTNKKKVPETVTVSFSDYQDPDFIFPSKFMYRNSFGDFVFIKTAKRTVAVQYLNEYTSGMFELREV